MKTLIVALLLFYSTAAHAQTIAPNDANLTYIGRWFDATISSTPVRVGISAGIRQRFKFTGTSLSMSFVLAAASYKPEIEWSIDGGAYTRQAVTATSVTMATGLASGTHTFEMWVAGVTPSSSRWTAYDGVRIAGITIDDGATISPWPTGATGRMLTIGDSIAEGMLILGSSPNAAPVHSGRQSFDNQVAAALNLENWPVAYGGSGFTKNGSGGEPYTHLNYPYKASGVDQTDPVFDIVLIEAGNNDGGSGTNIQTQYQTLIDEVLANNPSAKIFCMGLLYSNPADAPYIHNAAAAKGATYINTASWVYTRPNLSHPDLAGHTVIAAYLQPILASAVPSGTPTTRSLNGRLSGRIR